MSPSPDIDGLATSAFSRRGFLSVSAAGLLLALAGCSTGPSANTGGKAVLDVSLWGDAKRAKLYQKALDLFHTDHAKISSKLQFADLSPYLERLATSAAAHDLPDVLWMRDTHIGRYGSSGSLLDLSPYLGKTISTDAIGDSAVADGTIDGKVFALPTHFVGQAVLSDTTRLSALGITAADIVSWDDFAATAKDAADVGAGYYGSTDPTTGVTQRFFEAWIRQNGEELFGKDGGIGFTADTVEGWFEYWSKLRNAGVIPAPDVQIESEASGWTNDLLTTGKAALHPASTNHLTVIQSLTKNPIGLASMPADKDADDDWWFFPPILISVAADTPAPAAAAALVDFFVNSVDAGAITRLNQGAPSSSKIREAILPDLSEQETAFVEQISREQELPRRPFPIRPEGSEAFNTAITRAGQEIAYGRQSVSKAVDALVVGAKQTLASR